jgi:hypothetical protein
MFRLGWMLAGFCGGVIMARNAAAMTAPQTAAVILALVVGCGVTWWAGYRGKSSAVATAVSVAVAQADARAESLADARASAVAQQAVTLVLTGSGEGTDPRTLWTARRAVEAVEAEADRVQVRPVARVREADGYL